MYCISFHYVLILSVLTHLMLSGQEGQSHMSFTHFTIDSPLPGEGYGTGGFALADYNGDGDLNITLQRRSDATIYWYAYAGDDVWTRYEAARYGGGQLGAVALDVDQDGAMDLVMGRVWIQNPANLLHAPYTPCKVHHYNGGMSNENHDLALADVNQDGRLDIIAYAQEVGILRWYDCSNSKSWLFHDIAIDVNTDNVHGAFAPRGVGDLSGDGYPDVIMPFYWYENPGGHQEAWNKHAWPYVDVGENLYGRSFRSWIVDLDGDGDQDFIIADCV
ncbi:MAG: VCBS repeat-containing protein [Saprospiraceae bacterium]|nr:VCBS repeat-containing protein [Saprospiraceae bacterium]